MSLIADGTLYAGETEQSVRRLRDYAEVVNVHTWATAPLDRWRAHQVARGQPVNMIEAGARRITELGDRIVRPLDLGCLRIDVCTDDGWDPNIETLIGRLHGRAG